VEDVNNDLSSLHALQTVNLTSFPGSYSPAELSSLEDVPSSEPSALSCQPFSMDVSDDEYGEESKSQADAPTSPIAAPDGPVILPYHELFPFDDVEETEDTGEKPTDVSDYEGSMAVGPLAGGLGQLRGGPYSAGEGN
jgi:hypothetical protein